MKIVVCNLTRKIFRSNSKSNLHSGYGGSNEPPDVPPTEVAPRPDTTFGDNQINPMPINPFYPNFGGVIRPSMIPPMYQVNFEN